MVHKQSLFVNYPGKRTFIYLTILFALLVITKSNTLPENYRDKHCKYSIIVEKCEFGTYTDECGRQACYKGVNERCDDLFYDGITKEGKCIPGLACVCGKCTGCLNEHCPEIQLCRRTGFFDKKQTNSIVDYYYGK